MKNLSLLAGAALLGVLATGMDAQATTVTVKTDLGTGITNGDTTVHLSAPSSVTYGYYVGSLKLTVDGTPDIVGFCLDLIDHITPGSTYTYQNDGTPFDDFTLSASALTSIQSFFNINYNQLVTPLDYAGFQLGLWELVYDSALAAANYVSAGTSTYFTTGDLTAVGSTILNSAINFLDNLFDGTTANGSFDLTFLDSLIKDGDHQDLVYADNAPGAAIIPIPATGWLLAGGLLGLATIGRRRKAASVAR